MSVKVSPILDQFGRPQASGFFQGGDPGRRGDSLPASYTTAGYLDTKKLVSQYSWLQLMSAGRFLFANAPIVRGAIREQATLSFPLEPQYTGKDKEWGKLAENWLLNWHRINNLAGPAFNQDMTNILALLEVKVSGDFFILLTSADSGYPMIQSIRAHRVRSRDGVGTITRGPWQGWNATNGVILNAKGTPIAFNVLGDTEEEDRQVSARDLIHVFRPDYSDQTRGISHLCASIRDFNDVEKLREYEMRAQRLGASIGLIENNETGTADEAAAALALPAAGTDTSGTASALITQTYEQGMTLYYKARTGSGLSSFRNDRPTADAQKFEDKIVSGALYGIEWDPNFAMAIKEPGGAWARTIIEKIRRCIQNNQSLIGWMQRRIDGYGIAKAIKLKIIPAPSDGDWFSWEYQGPSRITADSGNEENAKREAYKLGLVTLKNLDAEKGRWWEETRDQREAEVRDLLRRAKVIAGEFGIEMKEALELLEQRSPNPATNNQAQPASDNTPP